MFTLISVYEISVGVVIDQNSESSNVTSHKFQESPAWINKS